MIRVCSTLRVNGRSLRNGKGFSVMTIDEGKTNLSEKTRPNCAHLSGTNLERAGDHNQRVTLHAIRVNGPITRTDLADITGLTPPAIANITRIGCSRLAQRS